MQSERRAQHRQARTGGHSQRATRDECDFMNRADGEQRVIRAHRNCAHTVCRLRVVDIMNKN